MKNIITIFRKEFLDLSRDKRTMRTMLLIPIFLYPVIITLVSQFMSNQTKKAAEEGLRIGVIENGNEASFVNFNSENVNNMAALAKDSAALQKALDANEVVAPAKIVMLHTDTSAIRSLIDADSVDAIFWFAPGFDSSLAHMQPADYKMFYNSSKHEFKVGMIFNLHDAYKGYVVKNRLAQLQLNETVIDPFTADTDNDLASTQEQTGQIIGGILPYFFIIFCLLGCMYPGIDMGAGEKERGTLETLLVSSASRSEIYIGKFLVVTLCGFISACAALIGMAIALKINSSIPASISDAIFHVLNPSSLVMILSILLPLNIFFASVILALSIMAKSFKEAQTMVSPLMILAVLPSMIGFLPGVTHNLSTAWIPILNVSLGTKAIISGTVETLPLIITYVSLILYALIGLFVSVRFFNDEKNIARS